MTGRIRATTRHEMSDAPRDYTWREFTIDLNDFPLWSLPRLMCDPPAGRLVLKAAIRAPIFDPGDCIQAYKLDAIAEEQAALRMRPPPRTPALLALQAH